jgi:hypothetical protein
VVKPHLVVTVFKLLLGFLSLSSPVKLLQSYCVLGRLPEGILEDMAKRDKSIIILEKGVVAITSNTSY